MDEMPSVLSDHQRKVTKPAEKLPSIRGLEHITKGIPVFGPGDAFGDRQEVKIMVT